jgi:uncharacterized tellurite resistance protein B-like protein
MYSRYRDLAAAKTFLEVDSQGIPCNKRLKTCVAVLLYQMAEADGNINHFEFEEIIRELGVEFKAIDEEAAELSEVGAFLAHEGKHLDRFIGEVNRHFDAPQREHLYDMILKVAQADGYLNPREQELAEFLREKLLLAAAKIL